MKKLFMILVAGLSFSLAASEAVLTFPNDKLPMASGDKLIISMQHGMQVYVNNCLGCHSLSFQRYKRTAEDLQIPEDIMLSNLILGESKIGDSIDNNMAKESAANWFGAAPPDLSLVARARGMEWLYNYLRGFYVDESRPYGVNNSVFKDVGMPHVLEQMQGLQDKSEKVKGLEIDIAYAQADLAAAKRKIEEGSSKAEQNEIIDKSKQLIHDAELEMLKLSANGEYFTIIREGQLKPKEFDQAMADLVYFLDYIGEPIKMERKRLGVWVLLFILVFAFVAYLLKKEYWKDVH